MSRRLRGMLSASLVTMLASMTMTLSAAPSAASCPNKCQDVGASGASHKFATPGANYNCDEEGCHTGEKPQTCNAKHTQCQISFANAARDLERIVTLVESDRAPIVGFLLDAYGDAVEYNPERQAVQVLGCDARVVAHLPVGTATMAALE